MELHFEELLGQITDFIKSEAKTETVVGEQFELGEFKCVPVIKVGLGFGSGGGEGAEPKKGKGQGMGAGAGMGIQPIGFLANKPAGAKAPAMLRPTVALFGIILSVKISHASRSRAPL